MGFLPGSECPTAALGTETSIFNETVPHVGTLIQQHTHSLDMPIDIEEFEEEEETNQTTSEEIIQFLLENKDTAFTRSEIATAIDRNPNTVGSNLSRLKERELVRHRKQHWALTRDLNRVAEAIRFSDFLSTVQITHGALIEDEADAQAWADAQPDQPHPSETTDHTQSSTSPNSDLEQPPEN